jgi:hypothetical protein
LQVLYNYPPESPVSVDLPSFCFPHGVQPNLLERTPSMTSLNDLLYSQNYLNSDASSFIFLLKVRCIFPFENQASCTPLWHILHSYLFMSLPLCLIQGMKIATVRQLSPTCLSLPLCLIHSISLAAVHQLSPAKSVPAEGICCDCLDNSKKQLSFRLLVGSSSALSLIWFHQKLCLP